MGEIKEGKNLPPDPISTSRLPARRHLLPTAPSPRRCAPPPMPRPLAAPPRPCYSSPLPPPSASASTEPPDAQRSTPMQGFHHGLDPNSSLFRIPFFNLTVSPPAISGEEESRRVRSMAADIFVQVAVHTSVHWCGRRAGGGDGGAWRRWARAAGRASWSSRSPPQASRRTPIPYRCQALDRAPPGTVQEPLKYIFRLG